MINEQRFFDDGIFGQQAQIETDIWPGDIDLPLLRPGVGQGSYLTAGIFVRSNTDNVCILDSGVKGAENQFFLAE